ncbi:MAG: hypothetical protein ACM3H8_09125 [Sphingobacteriales bacterium]
MKWQKINKKGIPYLLFLLLWNSKIYAQDSTKNELVLNVSYYMPASRVPYIQVNAKTKIDKKFQPVKGIISKVYLDIADDNNMLGRVVTAENGTAIINIPDALKKIWDSSATHTFIAIAEANKKFDETKAEVAVSKAHIILDTVAGAETKSINVKLTEFKNGEWVPVKGVEMKIGVKCLGGELPVSDEASYTTDSTGEVIAEFKRDSLPGDKRGILTLVAKVEDNDTYGNLVVEKKIPWGINLKYENNFFDKRTLWSTRTRTPFWLLFMAYSIITAVWGVIFYLVFQIAKIKRMGTKKGNHII